MGDGLTFREEVEADPSVCSRCDKRECTCRGVVDGGTSIATAPTGKAFLVGLKRFYRDWQPSEKQLQAFKGDAFK